MKTVLEPRRSSIALAGIAFALAASPALAGHVDVNVNIGLPGVAAPAPVYVEPRPRVVVQPVPVYVEPRPVYVEPRPVYVERGPGRHGDERKEWREHHDNGRHNGHRHHHRDHDD